MCIEDVKGDLLPFCEPVLIVVSGVISACTEVTRWEFRFTVCNFRSKKYMNFNQILKKKVLQIQNCKNSLKNLE